MQQEAAEVEGGSSTGATATFGTGTTFDVDAAASAVFGVEREAIAWCVTHRQLEQQEQQRWVNASPERPASVGWRHGSGGGSGKKRAM